METDAHAGGVSVTQPRTTRAGFVIGTVGLSQRVCILSGLACAHTHARTYAPTHAHTHTPTRTNIH